MKSASLAKRVARVAVLAVAVASPALAQQAGQAPRNVARLQSLEGNVLVGGASGLSSGSQGLVLQDGTRVLTTAQGRAVIRFDDGCEVRLEPNQRYVVADDRPCAARLLAVQSAVPPPAAPPPGTLAGAAMAGELPSAALFGAAAAGVAIWYRRDDSVSPN